MTNLAKILLRLSEVRERMNAISQLTGEALTPEIRAEAGTLSTEYGELEIRHRAALVAAEEDESRLAEEHNNGDGESAELRGLLRDVSMGDYLSPAAGGVGLAARGAEVNAALELPLVGPNGGVAIPWRVLAGEEPRRAVNGTEDRAFTQTSNNDGPTMQRPILQRLFGPGVMDSLGVRLDSVPSGQAEWPLLNAGASPAQTKEGTAVGAATAATFEFASLKPKKLSGSFEFSHELAASVGDIEQALRRDLADAVKSAMSDLIINGLAPTNAIPQNVRGFIVALGNATDLSAAEAAAADYGGLHSLGVDGIHASMEGEVMSVIGDESYKHAAGVYIAGSGESGSELLRRRSAGCMASTYIPDKANMKQSAILHAAGPNGGGIMRGDSVAAIWPTLEVVRDIYTKASQGVILTWISLWDAKVAFRSAAYKHVAINIG